MTNLYVQKEVAAIVNDDTHRFPKNLALASAWIMANFKGSNLKIFDVSKSSSLGDYYILGNAQNTTQARSMAEAVIVELKRHGNKVLSKEGLDDSDWILIDLGDVIVHVFIESAREVYNLDDLWRGAPTVEIPESYYFAAHNNPAETVIESVKEYF